MNPVYVPYEWYLRFLDGRLRARHVMALCSPAGMALMKGQDFVNWRRRTLHETGHEARTLSRLRTQGHSPEADFSSL